MIKGKELGHKLLMAGLLVCSSQLAFAAGWDKGGDDKGDMGGAAKSESWGKGMNMDMGMTEDGYMTARLRSVWNVDLSNDQRKKVRELQRELRKKHLAIQDKMEDLSDKLFELYGADKRDAKAIGKVYGELFDYRRQMIEQGIDAGNDVEALLTKEQVAQLKKYRFKPHWGAGWGGGDAAHHHK